ncbi:MAG: T9SS type A sorting domain-containing protein [Paludibacteraceae bacterium]|nr:T9SS type A sorting domain-containing protein [Paludibacteraceae bacterium]
MKKLTFILLNLLFTATTFAATITIPEEAQSWNIPADAIDVLEARDICAKLSSGATTGTKYYIMGYVKKIDTNHATNVSKYGNASFYIEQVKGANSAEDFYAYRVYGIDGERITDPNTVAVGDFVILYGELTKYQKNASYAPIYETVDRKAYIWNSTNYLVSGGNNEDNNENNNNTEDNDGVITITNTDYWTTSELSNYVGQTVEFTNHFYVVNNTKSGQLTIAPRRIFNPTNQALPLSTEYYSLLNLNDQASLTLTNVSGYHRIDERLHNLKVKVNSTTSLSLVSCDFRGNTRAEMQQGYNLQAINARGEHTLLVCYMNLEYYLVDNFGTGYGPDSSTDHQKQRTKTSQALAKINADIYALVEIQTGQGALAELAADLTKNTGRNFTYINDGSVTDGSFTKSGYIYCTDKVTPHGNMQHNDTYVENRKKVQGFTEKASGEQFILSVNHFKAKSGSGSGANKDQGDGQGSYNAARVQEAKSILSNYSSYTSTFGDEDFLIVGDLNAYGKEDPITTLTDWGMIDLHRTFHADSSYSYVYQGTLGYLDHALCNSTLYPQVTGMTPYHINAPEKDAYTYDGSSNDGTMFRCSDHDPILIGLRLGKDTTTDITSPTYAFYYNHAIRAIENAQGGSYTIYNIDGTIVAQEYITSATHPLPSLAQGIYILTIQHNNQRQSLKLIHL